MPLSLYVHVPFCTFRCAYCDFNTYAGLEEHVPAYVEALCREIRHGGAATGSAIEVHTVYFGGGTPSLLPPAEAARLLAAIRDSFPVAPGAEVTFEANPESASDGWLDGVLRAGATRLSLGVQSAQVAELRFLDRLHSFEGAAEAVRRARRAGFTSLNLDLIYGLPGQRVPAWEATLAAVLDLNPDHLSAYSLTIEYGTPLRARFEAGELATPDPDAAADLYETAGEVLAGAGFRQYEISNWARDGSDSSDGLLQHACRHNVQYWRNLPYLGFGAGAHGFADGERSVNVLSPVAYIERLTPGPIQAPNGSPAVSERRPIDRQTEMDETMMMGLRLTEEGIRHQDFHQRFGEWPSDRYRNRLQSLTTDGLLEADDVGYRLTARGRLLGNRVFREFV